MLSGNILHTFSLNDISQSARRLYHSGIAALTVGSVIRGVLDIYGTANSLTAVYWAAGGAFIVSGTAVYLIQSFGRGFFSRRRD